MNGVCALSTLCTPRLPRQTRMLHRSVSLQKPPKTKQIKEYANAAVEALT